MTIPSRSSYLRFRNTGHVAYRYFEFTATDNQSTASSVQNLKGRFFRTHIRDHFRYERMASSSTPPDFLHQATLF